VAVALISLLAGTFSVLAVEPQGTQSVSDGVYTDPQAARGQAIYRMRCASCHGNDLGGNAGPPLTGTIFIANWETQPLVALADKTRLTMPRNVPFDAPKLTRQEAADLLAFILQANKFPSGAAELASEDAGLKRVTFPARPGAPQKGPVAITQSPSLPPSGNVGQVMRGILFPSSNIVFSTQSLDPGIKRPLPENAGGDTFIWGLGIYPGWDMVDYAALSLAESATLMLTPGRVCENGRPVPVTDPDWIRFTLELAEAGKASFKASQTRNQEAVSDSTNQLNESCQNCHNVFRGRIHCVKAQRNAPAR
jgi:mono/diheme cytochrome c family protein